MVRDCRPDSIGIRRSPTLPGTPFYERVQLQLGEKQIGPIRRSGDDVSGSLQRRFYRQLHTVLHKEFRARQAWDGLTAAPPAHTCARAIWQAAGLLYRLLTLPAARWRLDRLAKTGHEGLQPLPAGLTLDEAARPTPNRVSRMDILLSHGYFIAEDAHEQQIMKPYPPLGLLYIASHLKARGTTSPCSTAPSARWPISRRTCRPNGPPSSASTAT